MSYFWSTPSAQSASPDLSGYDTVAARQAAIAALPSPLDMAAIQAGLLSDTTPLAEATAPAAGAGDKASRFNHLHPRLSSAQSGTLDANGQQTVIFTRTFTAKPAVTVLAVEDDTSPVPRFKVRRWLKADGSSWASGSPYGGCVIYGDRARVLPTITQLNGGIIVLLSSLITALNTIITQLSGYAPYVPAANVEFSLIALQPS